jgi:hypothetical protein
VTAAYASIVFTCAFLLLLLLLHLIKPEIDPKWRWISEYEIGSFGWMMRLAFFCWGAGVIALAVTLWPSLQPAPGILARWWLVAIATAMLAAGAFKTNAITDRTPSFENTVHTVAGLIVILTFPVAASLVVSSLLSSASWADARLLLLAATGLTWAGLIIFLASNLIAGSRGPSTERIGNPGVRVGWQNRGMVVTYAVWILLVAGTSLHI